MGLTSAKRVVRELITGQSGVHSVLLYGAPGSGKNVLAELLAQAWLCQQPGPEGADGICRACGAFERNTNADFLRIEPQGPSRIIPVKAITESSADAEANIPVISFFRTLPLLSRHKVVMIESADRMNNAASNALLKTLEEPYPHAKLILTTDTVGAILPTILSRCLAVACESPAEELLRNAFPDATEEELRMSEGTPGRLRHVIAHRAAYGRLTAFARGLVFRNPGEALVAAEELRLASDALEKSLGCGARAAQAESLEMLAIYLAREPQAPPEWTQYVTEAHRRIVQNGSASIVFDALMAKLFARN
ncbi:DNA polymerase III, delta' subunit [Fimbriimonas ginsengisoli Gsoil 348]|uniref:DNA polymerase III, delta' subunit n=1 Tax=Fimbriimonas ginsengisoli Gsoil 348 TaxID=661478 RepID=A0A068NPH5_FIMGI|nr:DNA polymerase III, delta' subunit [Fimbriimonas ginsengisoli Gsoil 348]